MREIDKLLDDSPTPELVKELAECKIRNISCFKELKNLNDKGEFIGDHIMLSSKGERGKLLSLFKSDPMAFMNDFANCRDNVKRYSSFLKNQKREKHRENDENSLQKHINKMKLFESILKEVS
jgi:hypothetical protein